MTTRTRPTPIETFTVWCALDNYEPTRSYMRSTIETFKRHDQKTLAYVMALNNEFRKRVLKGPTPVFLLDDGNTVIPLYTTGWNVELTEIFMAPFPVNPNGELKRPDGEPVDYRGWWLGPRTVYHLKAYE